MKNTVISGDLKGQSFYFTPGGDMYIGNGISGGVKVCKVTVARYEVESKDTSSRFSFGKAALGTAAFGGVGAIAGVDGKQTDTYRVAIFFRDGKQSLVEIDGKHFKALQAELFGVEGYTPPPAASSAPAKKHSFGRFLLSAVIFVVTLFVCMCIASAISPKVDGVIQLNLAGVLLIVAVPILAAVFLPKLFKKRK